MYKVLYPFMDMHCLPHSDFRKQLELEFGHHVEKNSDMVGLAADSQIKAWIEEELDCVMEGLDI